MHILIFGAAGMVGRKLTERLVRDGSLGGREITRATLHDVVAPEKPANAATRMMPGVSSAIFSISRTISVVRASDAAPGNCTDTMT